MVCYDPQTMSEPLDVSVLANLNRIGGAEMVAEIAALFIEETVEVMAAIRVAVEKRDATEARERAHYLKSSCDGIGAFTLRELCHRAELAAIDGDFALVSSSLVDVEAEYERVRVLLEADYLPSTTG